MHSSQVDLLAIIKCLKIAQTKLALNVMKVNQSFVEFMYLEKPTVHVIVAA